MINGQNISFSNKLSQQRLAQAQKVLDDKVVKRIICFALYLLGVDRRSISNLLKTPAGSVRSIIRAVFHSGLPAFEDRRTKRSTFLPQMEQERSKVTLSVQEESVVVDLGESGQIKIPRQNPLQAKVVLLTMFNNGLLASREVAEPLGISTAHVLNLARGLNIDDIVALVDKRQG